MVMVNTTGMMLTKKVMMARERRKDIWRRTPTGVERDLSAGCVVDFDLLN